MTTIFKFGFRTKCEVYSGIAVALTFSRMYGETLNFFIEVEYKTLDAQEQSGFRAGRSCMNTIF